MTENIFGICVWTFLFSIISEILQSNKRIPSVKTSTRNLIMNQKRKTPVIHILLSVGLSVSFAVILSLVIFNFVVINKMDEGEKVLTMFQDQSHFSKMKQAGAYDIIKFFKEKKQIMITTQAPTVD